MRDVAERRKFKGVRYIAAVLALAVVAPTAWADNPGYYGHAAPAYPFPYPRPSVQSSPHLKNPHYYSHHRQKYPGRWVWLMPSYHEILPTHRGYYDNYWQLQFLRDY